MGESTAIIHSGCGRGHIVLGIMAGHWFCEGCSERVNVELDIRPYLDEGNRLATIGNVLHVVIPS